MNSKTTISLYKLLNSVTLWKKTQQINREENKTKQNKKENKTKQKNNCRVETNATTMVTKLLPNSNRPAKKL